jgi:hypothetical protein
MSCILVLLMIIDVVVIVIFVVPFFVWGCRCPPFIYKWTGL